MLSLPLLLLNAVESNPTGKVLDPPSRYKRVISLYDVVKRCFLRGSNVLSFPLLLLNVVKLNPNFPRGLWENITSKPSNWTLG